MIQTLNQKTLRMSEASTNPRLKVVCHDKYIAEAIERSVPNNLTSNVLLISPVTVASKGVPDLGSLQTRLNEHQDVKFEQVIGLSSGQVYGARSSNPGLIREGFNVLEEQRSELSNRWLRAEKMITEFADQVGATSTVLRTCTIASPDQHDFISTLLASKFGITVFGRTPSIQFLAADDLAEAISAIVKKPQVGTFNLAPDDAIPIRKVLKITGARRIAAPTWLHAVSTMGSDIRRDCKDLIKFCWTISNTKFKTDFEYSPIHSSESALRRKLSSTQPISSDMSSTFHDPFGMEPSYIESCGRGRFRFCEKFYWRVEHRGLEHVPNDGAAVLVGTHRGFMPFDGVMMVHLMNQNCKRIPRFLIHPTLAKFGHMDGFLKRIGGILANQENAQWVLERDEIVAIFPEGIRGAFRKYDRDVYQVGNFGRNDFVKMAVQNGVPIIPFVSVGTADALPILHKFEWKWWKKLMGWPCFPVTPMWPLCPLPLPTKWHFDVMEPVCPKKFGVDSVDDREGIRELSQLVRTKMQTSIDSMLKQRPSIFYGSALPKQAKQN